MKTNQHAVEQIIKILEQAVKQIDGPLEHEELAFSQVPNGLPISRTTDRLGKRSSRCQLSKKLGS